MRGSDISLDVYQLLWRDHDLRMQQIRDFEAKATACFKEALAPLVRGQFMPAVFHQFIEKLPLGLQEKYAALFPFLERYLQEVSLPLGFSSFHEHLARLERKVLEAFHLTHRDSPLMLELYQALKNKNPNHTISVELARALKQSYDGVLGSREQKLGLQREFLSGLINEEQFLETLRSHSIPYETDDSPIVIQGHGEDTHAIQIYVLSELYQAHLTSQGLRASDLPFTLVFDFMGDPDVDQALKSHLAKTPLGPKLIHPENRTLWSLFFDYIPPEGDFSPKMPRYFMAMMAQKPFFGLTLQLDLESSLAHLAPYMDRCEIPGVGTGKKPSLRDLLPDAS